MDRPYKYITVLNYTNGQVYVYDYDPINFDGNAEDLVRARHYPDEVHYMVHKYAPALWTNNLYFCTREEAYRLQNEEQE